MQFYHERDGVGTCIGMTTSSGTPSSILVAIDASNGRTRTSELFLAEHVDAKRKMSGAIRHLLEQAVTAEGEF
jgi:hypothetical protein